MERANSRFRIIFILGGICYLAAFGEAANRLSADLSSRQAAILMGGFSLVGILFLAITAFLCFGINERILSYFFYMTNRRDWWGMIVRIVLFSLMILVSAVAVFTDLSRGTMQNLWFRTLVLVPIIFCAALVFPVQEPFHYGWKFLATLVIFSFAFGVGFQIRDIVAYPFSLTWSEGNRLYDYSLIFGKSLYQYEGELKIPYFAPGRYALWGIWFLIPNLPIWFHRLWNAVLWVIPSVALGWISTDGIPVKSRRWVVALWIAIFLYQGPIYAPLVLAAIWVLALNKPSLTCRSFAGASASAYLGLSRWTWSPSPGMWCVLIDLCLYYPTRKGSWIRRIAPTVLVGLTGSLPGLAIHWRRFFPAKITGGSGSSLEFSQPLLWYRLFPNASYPKGMLLGIVIATFPVLVILTWLLVSRRWPLNGLQILAFTASLAGTMAAGVVISTKIGGGGDLHNFDMYFITLAILGMIYLKKAESSWHTWPLVFRLAALVAFLIPVWNLLQGGGPLNLPPRDLVENALDTIQTEVQAVAALDGDVLFMDQRQLLTFGTVSGIGLIPDYEKKYLMDQAMAANRVYFERYYQDLEAKRFDLILTEPMSSRLQDRSYAFNEENNAWVKWISKVTLCYYQPKITLSEVGVQLLVPKEGRPDCH